MKQLYRLHLLFVLGLLIMGISLFCVWQLSAEIAYSQDSQIEEVYDKSLDNDTLDNNYFDSTQPQNPDPGFMDEVEPGEYNQSDDTTELNDNY